MNEQAILDAAKEVQDRRAEREAAMTDYRNKLHALRESADRFSTADARFCMARGDLLRTASQPTASGDELDILAKEAIARAESDV